MKAAATVLVLTCLVAAPARADDLEVSPASVSFGELHPREQLVVTLALSNPNPRPIRIACKGAHWKFAPERKEIIAAAIVRVKATYTEGKKPRTEGRLELAITCNGVKVPLVGTRSSFPPVAPPADAAALAEAVVGPAGAWAGFAYSPSETLYSRVRCGSPMQGDADACCTVALVDLAGKASASWVVTGAGCARAGAQAPADVVKALAARFGKGGWVAMTDRAWSGEGMILPDGRMLVWRLATVWLGPKQLAALAAAPIGLGLSADGTVGLVRAGDADHPQLAAIAIPAP